MKNITKILQDYLQSATNSNESTRQFIDISHLYWYYSHENPLVPTAHLAIFQTKENQPRFIDFETGAEVKNEENMLFYFHRFAVFSRFGKIQYYKIMPHELSIKNKRGDAIYHYSIATPGFFDKQTRLLYIKDMISNDCWKPKVELFLPSYQIMQKPSDRITEQLTYKKNPYIKFSRDLIQNCLNETRTLIEHRVSQELFPIEIIPIKKSISKVAQETKSEINF